MGGQGFPNDFAASMSNIFDEVFGDFMGRRGGGSRSGGRERGSDLRYNMEIALEEAYLGKTAEIEVPTKVVCQSCTGSGAKRGSSPKVCPSCEGSGRVRAASGYFSIERTCPTCQGRGEVISDPCLECNGAGRVTEERKLSVNIPSGIEDGTRIRLGGEGEAGVRGGPPGDLYIFLSIKPHEFFQRDGADIFCRVPVSMTTAALGGEVQVPTIDGGKTKVKVPEGSQTGKQFRLKGKGMPVLRSTRVGEMYIQVAVETPRNLTRRQRELLEEFEKASSAENHPDSSGFFARVRDLFDKFGA
jgi:molecular chaperone DnaJ